MAKKYHQNYSLDLARTKIFSQISKMEQINIFEAFDLSSGDYLPTLKMNDGKYKVYGGGGIIDKTHSKYNVKSATIGIGRVGARCGCVFPIEENSWVTDNALYVSRLKKEYDSNFLIHYLSFLKLNKYANQSAQPVISQRGISKATIPIININQQIKISKALNAIEKGEEFEDDFNLKSSLNTVANLIKFIDEISFQKKRLIELRKNILKDALQGKLVPQEPNDEPASDLLKKIKAEKDRLIKEGQIKKVKLSPSKQVENFYELPKGWEWSRLEEISLTISDGVHYAPSYLEKGIPCISAKDIYNHKINLNDCNYVSEKEYALQKNKFSFKKNSLLVTKSGSIGRTAIFNGSYDLYAVESIGIINFNDLLIIPGYIQYLLDKTFDSITYAGDFVRGLGVKHLTLTLLGSIPVPLPSLAEQKRIVEKVNKLMKLCDELELKIKESQKNADLLMQAVLQESFGNSQETI